MIGKFYKNKWGFTLIESLVAISLFALVMTAALGLFLTYSKAQKKTSMRQKAVNQLSVEIEKIAQDIRLNKIQFQCSGCGAIPAYYKTGNLYGGDGSGGKEVDIGLANNLRYFYVPAAETSPPTSSTCAGFIGKEHFYRYKRPSECEPIFLIDNVKLTDVGIYISPSYNPYPSANLDCKGGNVYNGYYCECSNNSQCYSNLCVEGFCYVSQPLVTISLTAQIGADANNVVVLQTTVSSRVYQ